MKYRIESLPDVDSPREDVQVITVYVKGGHSSLGPMHTIGLSSLAKALSCMAVVQEGSRGSVVTIAGAAGDLALLTELFNSTLTQCNVGLKEALRGRAFYSQSDRFRFRRGYTLGFFRGVANRVREAVLSRVLMGAGWRLVDRWGAGRWRRFRHLPAPDFHSVCIVRFGTVDSLLLVNLWMQEGVVSCVPSQHGHPRRSACHCVGGAPRSGLGSRPLLTPSSPLPQKARSPNVHLHPRQPQGSSRSD